MDRRGVGLHILRRHLVRGSDKARDTVERPAVFVGAPPH